MFKKVTIVTQYDNDCVTIDGIDHYVSIKTTTIYYLLGLKIFRIYSHKYSN